MDKIHIPVLLKETIEGLNIKEDGFYIDCTLGDGGHSYEILSRLSSKGLLLSIDRDRNAIDFVREYYNIPDNWILVQDNFVHLQEIVNQQKISRKPNGILMDLGLSSRQLEESHNRGFSYQEESEPLDMRMDDQLTITALDLLKALEVQELTKLFKVYGEERYAKPIAQAIKENISEIESVGDLTNLIYKVVPVATNNKNPSRRVFQALRIAVNDEINNLKEGLDKAFEILSPNGKLLVISFHSLEDRVVKNFFNKKDEEKKAKNLTKKPIQPSQEEIKNNPKSSSAKLRILRKI